jgi:hypothetical protein
LSASVEWSDTFEFGAPLRGRKTVQLYQFTRLLHFTYDDARAWHKNRWEHRVTEWLPRIVDDSTSAEYDPACGGDVSTLSSQSEANPLWVIFRHGLNRVAKLAVRWTDTERVTFADSGFDITDFFDLDHSPVVGSIPADMVPAYVPLLLGREMPTDIEAQVQPAQLFSLGAPAFEGGGVTPVEVEVDLDDVRDEGLVGTFTSVLRERESAR